MPRPRIINRSGWLVAVAGAALALVFALAALGCQGEIRQPHEDATGPHGPGLDGNTGGDPGAAASPGVNGDAVREADDAMRAANPELFEIAQRYFPSTEPAAGRKRLFRLTRTQLDLTTKTLLPAHHDASAAATLPSDPLQTNYEFADNLRFTAANFTPYVGWVDALAARVRADPASVIDCAAQTGSAACLDTQARRFVTRAFRGVVTEAQVDRYADFFTASAAEVGLPDATADLVALALTSPSYVFRDEVRTDAAGTLLPAQHLQALTYTLADAPPEALGLDPENAAQLLGTKDAIEATVAQVLASPEARAKLLRFFIAWLEVREPDEFAIATDLFPEFTSEVARAAVDETHAFLTARLAEQAPRLTDITQSTESFVSDAIAFLYGLDADDTDPRSPTRLDPAQRLGIFTQPAVIASHSGPSTTRLVKRGVFFTRKIMCLPLGAPPEDVDTTVPTTPGATERQRIETVTAPTRCQACHAFINPFGFMQENYDPIGRWRTLDEGLPIDARIAVDFLDEGPLITASPVEALRAFTSSYRFQQCFTRQLFRYYMGRDETRGDDPLLRQMFFSFADGAAQDIARALRTLAGSPAFAARREEAP